MSKLEATGEGLTGAEAGVGSSNTVAAGAGGGAIANPAYYRDVREALATMNRLIDEQVDGTVELRDIEVIDELAVTDESSP